MEKYNSYQWASPLTYFYQDQACRYIDLCVYSMLQWYFMPAMLMSKSTEVDQWVSSFSTNGLKVFNICKP